MRRLSLVFVVFLVLSGVLVFEVPFVSAYTGTITYNAGTDTITAIGGNSTVPMAFEDLYLADVAGGWGQITKQSTTQYAFSCKVILGNGSSAGTTYFSDSAKQITFNAGCRTGSSQYLIEVKAYATAVFGVVIDTANKMTKSSIQFIDLDNTYYGFIVSTSNSAAIIYHYGTNFVANGRESFFNGLRIWNVVADGLAYFRAVSLSGQAVDINNYIATGRGYGLRTLGSSMTIANCFIFSTVKGINFDADSDAIVRDSQVYVSSGVLAAVDYVRNYSLIDVKSNVWNFTFNAAGTVWRKNTYDLTVLNGEITDFVENANVTLSKGGVQIGTWLTNSSGQIDTQTLTYGFYNQTGGNTMYDGSYPFVLTVTHPDWADYTSRFYVTEKTKMTISMQATMVSDNGLLVVGLFFAVMFVLVVVWFGFGRRS